MRHRLSLIKYSEKYGVAKAVGNIRPIGRQYIRARKARRDGAIESLKDRSKRLRQRPNRRAPARVRIGVKFVCVVNEAKGRKFYQYAAIDEYSRWRYAEAFEEQSACSSRQFAERLIKAFPHSIRCVQTDNGPEFADCFTSRREKPALFQRSLKAHNIVRKSSRLFTPRHNRWKTDRLRRSRKSASS